jgi:tryptophanase
VANVRAVRDLCQMYGVPLILDASRVAENAFFVKQREVEFSSSSIQGIIRQMANCADAVIMSAKKDGLANIGGFLSLRDADLAEKVKRRMVVTEGFPTYGGLAGRDLDAIAVGLREVTDEDYLAHRIGQVSFLATLLRDLGVPIVEPPGGHGVFIDAGAYLPHLPKERFPGQALSIALYLEGGIRGVEIGSVMFGEGPGKEHSELVRLAIPRRVYSNAQLGEVARAFARLKEQRSALRGVTIIEQPPVLRHFTAKFALV